MAKLAKKASVGGDMLYLTASRIVVAMIGLVTSMLLARFRTLDEYATYSQIIMVADLVCTLLLLGLPNSINYFLAKTEDPQEKQRFLSVYTTLNTLLTVAVGVILWFATPLIIAYFNNPLITSLAYVFAIYPWSSVMINSLSNVSIIYGRTNKLMVFNVAYAATTLLVLLTAKVFSLSFGQYMLLYMLEMLSFAVFGVCWIRKMAGALRPWLDWRLIKAIFVFSIPMGLASVVGSLNVELGKLVVGKFFSTAEYAIYANAAKELPVTLLATSITAVLLPKLVQLLSDEKRVEATSLWGYSINLSLCFMCLVVGAFIVFAPDIMSLFYSEKYVTAGGVAVFRISACVLLFRTTYWGIVLNATGKTKFIFISSVLTLLFNLIGNVAFCYLFGFVGPAISNLLVTGIMAFVQLKFTTRVIAVPFKNIFPWKSMAVLLVQTAGFVAVFSLIKYVLIGEYTRNVSIVISIGLGVVWTLLYGLLNWKFIKRNWVMLNK